MNEENPTRHILLNYAGHMCQEAINLANYLTKMDVNWEREKAISSTNFFFDKTKFLMCVSIKKKRKRKNGHIDLRISIENRSKAKTTWNSNNKVEFLIIRSR